MKPKDEKKQISFEQEYTEIMKYSNDKNAPIHPTPQWINPKDFIVKFSLYQETPNSITSTDTSVNLG